MSASDGRTSKKKFSNKTCSPVPRTVVYMHTGVLTVTGTTSTFVYKEVAICPCVAAQNIAHILLFLDDLFDVLTGI